MNRIRTAGLAVTVCCALAGDGSALAKNPTAVQNPPAKPDAEPRVGERAPSIEEARKDFDALKSLRNAGGESKEDALRLAIPKMHNGADAAPTRPTPTKPTGPTPGSNWLVDAMEEKASPQDRRKQEGDRRWEDGHPPPKGRDASEGRTESPAATAERERNDRSAANNPFAPFLGGWMTPQDFALLMPALEPSASTDDLRTKGPSTAALGDFSALSPDPGLKTMPGGVRSTPPPGSATSRRDNPYLETLGGTGSSTPFLPASPQSPPRAVTTAPSSGVMPSPQVPPPTPRPNVPEFVRPTGDDKYFKPLKRF